MPSNAAFSLARATPDDMTEIVNLQYACFPEFVRLVFMGCHTEADVPRIRDKYIQMMQDDPSDIWIKVTDNKTGRIIAASDWKVYITKATYGSEQPDWLEGEEREKSMRIIEQCNAYRARAMPGPYIRPCYHL
jgi:hypothetical protein